MRARESMDGSVTTGIAAAPGSSAGILSCEFRQIGSEGWNCILKLTTFMLPWLHLNLILGYSGFQPVIYSQCSADIAWPLSLPSTVLLLLFFPNITLLQNQYFSALLSVLPSLVLDVLSGHFSLLNIESGLFALLSASALCSCSVSGCSCWS